MTFFIALEEGRTPLILTERIKHVEILQQLFKGFAKNIIVLSGSVKKKEREQSLTRLNEIKNEDEMLIIATGKYIGEGFDYSRLDTSIFSYARFLERCFAAICRSFTPESSRQTGS